MLSMNMRLFTQRFMEKIPSLRAQRGNPVSRCAVMDCRATLAMAALFDRSDGNLSKSFMVCVCGV